MSLFPGHSQTNGGRSHSHYQHIRMVRQREEIKPSPRLEREVREGIFSLRNTKQHLKLRKVFWEMESKCTRAQDRTGWLSRLIATAFRKTDPQKSTDCGRAGSWVAYIPHEEMSFLKMPASLLFIRQHCDLCLPGNTPKCISQDRLTVKSCNKHPFQCSVVYDKR